jgi:hypothetical protein
MRKARQAVASALVTIVDLFNPDVVIVGGGIAAAEGDRLLGPAREQITKTAFRVQARRARIVEPTLGDDVSLVGGLILANAAVSAVGGRASVDCYGLTPVASRPGQNALPIKPVNGDHSATDEPKRAVAIG